MRADIGAVNDRALDFLNFNFSQTFRFGECVGNTHHTDGAGAGHIQTIIAFVDGGEVQFNFILVNCTHVNFYILHRLIRIAFWHDVFAYGCFVRESSLNVIQVTINNPLADFNEVRLEDREYIHRLRIAQAAVVLEHLRAVVGDHDAGVERAAERAAAPEAVRDPAMDLDP